MAQLQTLATEAGCVETVQPTSGENTSKHRGKRWKCKRDEAVRGAQRTGAGGGHRT